MSGETSTSDEDQVREACLRLLATRPRSRHELVQRLRGRDCSELVLERVLDRLTAVGLVDDAAFANAWVRSRHAHSGKSRRALAAELRTKGIGDEQAKAALAQVDDDDEHRRATEVIARKLRSTVVPADAAGQAALTRRLVGMLARRGYPADVVRSVVEAELRAGTERLT
ncbi:MAG: regulatory protein RecX [Mycobacteriaceae bacterium]